MPHIEQEIQNWAPTPVSQGLRRGVNHSYRPSGCAAPGTALDVLVLHCSQHTLLTHTHLAIYKHLQVLSAQLLQSCSTPTHQVPACINSGTRPSQISHLAFLNFDFHMVPAGPLLQSAYIALNAPPALEHVNWSHGLISSANLVTAHSTHLLHVTEKVRKSFEIEPLHFVKNPVLTIFINPLLQFSKGEMATYLANNKIHSRKQ